MAGLSARYAAALFELAADGNRLDESLEQAVFLRDMLKQPDCRKLISHPRIPMREKIDFLEKALSSSINDDLMGFLNLAVTKNREAFIIPALSVFIGMVNKHKNRTVAKIVSANALSDAQVNSLRAALSTKLNKQVEITVKVDPSLIGGLNINVDGYLIDRTIKRKMSEIKNNLL